MKRASLATVALFAFGLLATPIVAQPTDASSCIDLVVVAQITKYEPEPIPVLPDAIIMTWPWTLTLQVERVLYGKESARRITVTRIMHTRFNPDIQHFVFMLRRHSKGYVSPQGALDVVADVVRDHRGNFIMPIGEPLSADYLFPGSWIPDTYEKYLYPVTYDYKQAWWFGLDPNHWEDAFRAGTHTDWLSKSNGHVYAKRGLHLDDMPKFL